MSQINLTKLKFKIQPPTKAHPDPQGEFTDVVLPAECSLVETMILVIGKTPSDAHRITLKGLRLNGDIIQPFNDSILFYQHQLHDKVAAYRFMAEGELTVHGYDFNLVTQIANINWLPQFQSAFWDNMDFDRINRNRFWRYKYNGTDEYARIYEKLNHVVSHTNAINYSEVL